MGEMTSCTDLWFLAMINALSEPFHEKSRLQSAGFTVKEAGYLGFIHPGDRVAIIGAGSYMEDVRDICGHVDVIDLRPAFAIQSLYIGKEVRKEPEGICFHGPEDTEGLLAMADVVLATGCTLVNGTFGTLREQSAASRVFALFGPSARSVPEYFQEQGVHYVLTGPMASHGQKGTGYTIKI